MGNTISTAPNILFLLDHVHCPGSPLQHQTPHPHPHKASTSRTAPFSSSSSSSSRRLPRPLFLLRRRPAHTPASAPSLPSPPTLNLYTLPPKPRPSSTPNPLFAILHSLCDDLRLDRDRPRLRSHAIWPKGYAPVALFHLCGDFKNPAWNGVVSVLLEKSGGDVDMGMESVAEANPFSFPFPFPFLYSHELSPNAHPPPSPPPLPSSSSSSQYPPLPTPFHSSPSPPPSPPSSPLHRYIHLYEPTHLAQSFHSIFQKLAKTGVLKEVHTSVDEERLLSMEAYALFWAKGRWEGLVWGQDEGRGMREEWEGELEDVWGDVGVGSV
ncbi:hypothetical protein K491DRAFT_714617 [Lophiostoma macrostomum CBS 122681]|uniref:Uncharacterized protein n=1 Tax=Lophiostoma macrostomum CBS 122681 TaxID=1314788 RepID=A0A6A6TB63_9PLEO|nr:hypothetical protein K491DRAFT_714617 [Lophiostoma macrostomum CBS 122681]